MLGTRFHDDLRTVFQDSLRPTSDLPHNNHKIGRRDLELKPGLELNLGLGGALKPTISNTGTQAQALGHTKSVEIHTHL